MGGFLSALSELLALVAALVRRMQREQETREQNERRDRIVEDPVAEFGRRFGSGSLRGEDGGESSGTAEADP